MESASGFEIFNQSHLIALGVIVLLGVGLSRVTPEGTTDRLPRVMAVLLLVLVIVKPIVFVSVYGEPWGRSLPLALCRINEFLCIYLLFRRSYPVFEIAYFLSIGSVAALLMPDLSYGIEDPRFGLFFVSHGLAVLSVVYAISGYGFRPTLHSVGRVLIFLGVYTLIVSVLNLALDANYLFLREKPQGASVLDYMGPWPIYVIALIALAIVLCFLCYLPFAKPRDQSAEDRGYG